MLSIRTGAMLDLVAELVQSQTVGDWFYQPWPAELSQNESGMSSQYHHRSFSVRYVSSRFDLQDQGSVVRRLRGDPQPYTTASLEVFWFAYLQMDDAHEAYVSTLNLQDEIIAALQVAPTGGPVRLAVETAECELGDNFDARGRVRVIATYHTTLPS